jgi:hypothetical protein
MLLTLKFLTLASLFVGTGGAVFTEWGRKHQFLVILAGVVAIAASTYLIRDIYNDLKGEIRQELGIGAERTPIPTASATKWEQEAKAAAERAQREADALTKAAEDFRNKQQEDARRANEEEARRRADATSAPTAKKPAPSPVCVYFNGRQICE